MLSNSGYDVSEIKGVEVTLVDSKPIYEALVSLLRRSVGWLAGDIWLQSAGMNNKMRGWLVSLSCIFTTFICRFPVQVQVVGVAQKL